MDVVEIFHEKLAEFAEQVKVVFPEYEGAVGAFMSLSKEERFAKYQAEVAGTHAYDMKRGCPGAILPGITLTESVWAELSETTQKAVYDYLSILDLCAMVNGDGSFSQEWADKVMRDWRTRMNGADFKGFSEKISDIFGKMGTNLPPLPEKFLKGKLAKLAEEMVREFRPEDFGLTEAEIKAVESDPTRAFEILMEAATKNPAMLQRAIQRVGNRLKEKVLRGEFKPQDLAAEAEEMIAEFRTHPAFVEMMEAFKSIFSFEDPEVAREAGRDGEGRLSIARSRLRKKLEKRKGAK